MTKWMLLDVVSDFLHDWVMFGLEHLFFNGETTPDSPMRHCVLPLNQPK